MIAMNGISYGTTKSGMSCFFAASRSGPGTSGWSKPMPNPSAATSCLASRATYERCFAAVSRL